MIALHGVTVAVPALTPPGTKTLLDGVSIDLAEHRIALIGANGSGKSTLLRLLNGLIVPTQGRVDVEGHDTRRDAAAVRRLVGFTFTDPLSHRSRPVGSNPSSLTVPSGGKRRTKLQSSIDQHITPSTLLVASTWRPQGENATASALSAI